YADGSVLQTPIYMKAVSVLANLEGIVTQGSYRQVDGTTAEGAKLLARDAEHSLAFALSIPPRIRDGQFEAVQAKAARVRPWQPGRDITRTDASLLRGHRFAESAGTRDDG
ncbi:MAG: hypothetical protein JJE01_12310, partial [Gemmatimonadetes bacterium]|nr:hypothetical protein [Gemmatimonadota bacterium]